MRCCRECIVDNADQLGSGAEELIVTPAEILEARGFARAWAEMLLEQLVQRFGSLDPLVEHVVREADVAQLRVWALRILRADTLDDVLS